ncbi:MAG: YjbH domain-containing protein [Rhodobacteraceae bacterium]|nr:YjbH domain-containing protein [Paracoccaceae bacterium]
MIDLPSAVSPDDAELSFTTSHFGGQTRNTLSFQIFPRLSGSFRYSIQRDIRRTPSSSPGDLFDRSFSLQYRFVDETRLRPAIAVGLNDFLGTGIYSSEYFAATKTFGPRLRVTGGIGWGRLAGVGSFDNPLSFLGDRFETRQALDVGKGGTVSTDQLFTGPAAFFGGIEYQLSDKVKLLAEYSSDAYPFEDGSAFERNSPFNFGLTYKARDNINISANYMYGSEVGVTASFITNPKNRRIGSGRESAPLGVVRRARAFAFPIDAEESRRQTQEGLSAQGIELIGFSVTGDTAQVEIANDTYFQNAQAIGRTARTLSRSTPRQITTFVIVPVVNGIPGDAVFIQRADLEELEFSPDNAWSSFARARFDNDPSSVPAVAEAYPRTKLSVGPYVTPSLFDPDDPLRADAGISFKADAEIAHGLVLSGELRHRLIGNLSESTRASTSVLPRVRSDFNLYDREGETALVNLQAAYYFDVAPEVTGRVTAGYLEPMFGGVSGELLWSPRNRPYSLGVEVNYVKQRDFDQQFGFQDYEIATGHGSLYWDMGNGFHTQLDVGRYLAGDWGATIGVDRQFNNGWSIGAFATFTEVSSEEFGEGSFDKGIRLTVPLTWVTGEPRRDTFSTTIRPVQRDGGARLNVNGRLYEVTRPLQTEEYYKGWGRFWR